MVNSRPRLCLSKKSSWVDPTRCRHQPADAEAQRVKIWSKQVREMIHSLSLRLKWEISLCFLVESLCVGLDDIKYLLLCCCLDSVVGLNYCICIFTSPPLLQICVLHNASKLRQILPGEE